jgi:hypothetical protein
MKIPNKRVQGMSHKVRHPLTRDVLLRTEIRMKDTIATTTARR